MSLESRFGFRVSLSAFPGGFGRAQCRDDPGQELREEEAKSDKLPLIKQGRHHLEDIYNS